MSAHSYSGERLPEGIDRLRSGNLRARANVPGLGRQTVGVFPTVEEAVAVREAFVKRIAADVARAGDAINAGLTLEQWHDKWFDRRELVERKRGVKKEKSRWKTHVATSPFYKKPMRWVSTTEWMEWLDRVQRGRAEQTSKNILNLVRVALDDAVKFGHIDVNPLTNAKVAKVARAEKPWTFLTVHEQEALLQVIPEEWRYATQFALATGLRLGELAFAPARYEGCGGPTSTCRASGSSCGSRSATASSPRRSPDTNASSRSRLRSSTRS